jgi:hypothetical protein
MAKRPVGAHAMDETFTVREEETDAAASGYAVP